MKSPIWLLYIGGKKKLSLKSHVAVLKEIVETGIKALMQTWPVALRDEAAPPQRAAIKQQQSRGRPSGGVQPEPLVALNGCDPPGERTDIQIVSVCQYDNP